MVKVLMIGKDLEFLLKNEGIYLSFDINFLYKLFKINLLIFFFKIKKKKKNGIVFSKFELKN